jgi:hypothetical protein
VQTRGCVQLLGFTTTIAINSVILMSRGGDELKDNLVALSLRLRGRTFGEPIAKPAMVHGWFFISNQYTLLGGAMKTKLFSKKYVLMSLVIILGVIITFGTEIKPSQGRTSNVEITPVPLNWDWESNADTKIVFNSFDDPIAPDNFISAVGDVVDVFTAPINNTVVQSNVILQQDVEYSILLSGMFLWGHCDPYNCPDAEPDYNRWGDAGFLSDAHFEPGMFSDPFWNDIIYLTINGIRPTFPTYNPDHLYIGQILGNGEKLTFYINDCYDCWGDNFGNLRIEIVEGYPNYADIIGVKPFQQRSLNLTYSDWGDDTYGDPDYVVKPNDCGSDIIHCGCRLTNWAMTIDHIGLSIGNHTNPGVLNEWLRNNDGYDGLYVNSGKVLEYAYKVMGIGKYRLFTGPRDELAVSMALSLDLPVNLKAWGGKFFHHVLATGQTYDTNGNRTFYINDPYFYDKFNLVPTLSQKYGNTFNEYSYIMPDPNQYGWVFFTLASPAELIVTDPLGRKTGYDPRSGTTYMEIPEAYYKYETNIDPSEENYTDDPHVYKVFELYQPVDGEYLLEVIGLEAGTYTLYARMFDNEVNETSYEFSEEIIAGEINEYQLDFSSNPNSPQSITIDIRPGNQTNTIICTKLSTLIPVAVITTDDFDAVNLNPTSVTFEGANPSTKQKGKTGDNITDVDGDGDLDRLFYFVLGDTNLTCLSTIATLQGLTYENISVIGSDTVKMISGQNPYPPP